MQTFSDMQRNRSDIQSVKFFIFCVFLVWYELLSAVYAILPPLIGLFFAYVISLNNQALKKMEDYTKSWYLAFLFLVFAEQIHGFELFSSIFAFIFYYYFLHEWLSTNFKLYQGMLIVYVCSAYILIFCVSNIILYIKDQALLQIYKEYLYYMVFESFLALFVFRDKYL